jgi:GDP-4-dehydro-6-deoxy-D-mannose reductase
MRSFVTGIDGFIGSWLVEALLKDGDQVSGLSRKEEGTRDGIRRFRGDITDATAIEIALRDSRPERIFHLAAQNNIADSFADPQATMNMNVVGSLHLFEAVRRLTPDARVVSMGSSSEYGRTAGLHEVIEEDLPLLPTSPYGISKATQSMLARVYATTHRLSVVHVRPFAIIGPRKVRDALSDFCQGIIAVERGERNSLLVGNLSAIRDFLDVRDCVRVLVLLSAKGQPGEAYNICNAHGRSMEDILSILGRLSSRPVEFLRDPARMRPADDQRIVGSNEKIRGLGYRPGYSLGETVSGTLDYWRTQTAASIPS